MEEVHHNHKHTGWDWLEALKRLAPPTMRRTMPRAQSATSPFMVTPWSGRSPRGWSA